jgi:hypothetical protein
MRGIFALLALILAASACSARSPEERFSADLLGRFRAARPGAAISAKPGDPLLLLVAKGGGWEEGQISLSRIYGYCARATATECETVKAEFVRKLPGKAPAGIAPSRLRLVIRNRHYWDYFQTLPPKDGGMAFAEPIGADLYAFLAADSPDAIMLVGKEELDRLKLGRAEAWALALRQTLGALPPLPTAALLARHVVVYQDQAYLASLLLDRDGWARLAAKVGPDLFVTVVSDQYVFIAKRPDGPSMDEFKKGVAQDCAEQERCLSPNVYRFRNGGLTIAR